MQLGTQIYTKMDKKILKWLEDDLRATMILPFVAICFVVLYSPCTQNHSLLCLQKLAVFNTHMFLICSALPILTLIYCTYEYMYNLLYRHSASACRENKSH